MKPTRQPCRTPAIPALKARWRDLRDAYLDDGDKDKAALIDAGLRRLCIAVRQQKREHAVRHGWNSGCSGWMALTEPPETFKRVPFPPDFPKIARHVLYYCPFCGAEVER